MDNRPAIERAAWRRCAAAVLLLCAACAGAQADDTLELRVKSAFLFNFAKFVSWPPPKLQGASDPILYCVLDREPLAGALQEALSGKSVDNHPLLLRRVARAEEMRDCHIAYLGAADGGRLPALAGSSVLTVYDGDAPLRAGIVRFYLDERKVRFEINAAGAEREGLQVSSRLLGVASVIRE
ncbi:MAG TPA: YfiR family protein [Nevskia sp.]|nr:YfiR family protein [Nevskia sp.]